MTLVPISCKGEREKSSEYHPASWVCKITEFINLENTEGKLAFRRNMIDSVWDMVSLWTLWDTKVKIYRWIMGSSCNRDVDL